MTINDINLEGLSDQEKKYVLDILKEYAETGKSDLYNSIVKDDWKEVPVDIETFLTDDRYLGKAWKSPSGELKIYPFWMNQLKKLFPDNTSTSVNNFIESGARGLGKSEIATGAAGAYLMYRVMCLKDPLEYFGLKPTEKVCFAFMNITKTLAEEIAVDKFQKTIQLSPWFMSKGRMTTLNNSPYWIPPDPIAVIIGSQPSHVIGQPIYYCLDGATEIYTDTGVHRIEDLVDKTIRVLSVDESGSTQMSDLCTVEPTATSLDEYQIELEDGSVIKCTPNHRFMLKDGTYKEAQYLTLNDELYDIEDIDRFGYIYKLTMAPTNKIYVGKREKSKFDESYYGSGRELKKDLLIYGKESVKREILCWGSSRADLNEKEVYWISKLNANYPSIGYNVHKGGAGGNSLNSTEMWSELHKGEKNGRYGKPVTQHTKDLIGRANTGKIRSQEFKDKLSKATRGVKKPEGFGDKISKANKGRKNYWSRKPVLCIETNIIYESLTDAEKKLDIRSQSIGRSCRTDYTAGGYHWRYVNED